MQNSKEEEEEEEDEDVEEQEETKVKKSTTVKPAISNERKSKLEFVCNLFSFDRFT